MSKLLFLLMVFKPAKATCLVSGNVFNLRVTVRVCLFVFVCCRHLINIAMKCIYKVSAESFEKLAPLFLLDLFTHVVLANK